MNKALCFLRTETFDGSEMLRTTKFTQLPQEEIEKGVKIGKIEEHNLQKFAKLGPPYEVAAVNVFGVPAVKD